MANTSFEDLFREIGEMSDDQWERNMAAAEVEPYYAAYNQQLADVAATLITEPLKKKRAVVPRKSARAWTAEEHKLFLKGLEKYDKGDWKSISRWFVFTRTPTQVASHAQKYFKHLENNKVKKSTRISIFDTTY